uniref:Variant surface glycoprotein YnAT 1.1 n=1 Tax=Trypanosoma congolense TaxID=5692 RepID=VSY1_TRYCO|nr:RecName: Full=Variant surface glycoprotein YnAT 1.1; Short=VSG; Flags: Precursor [Trypanosoma congolense]AAA30298.1 variant surface glycoprotein precursor [Trypanosoma congolense]
MKRVLSNVLKAWIFTIVAFHNFSTSVTADAPVNAAEYNALCRLYNIARAGEGLKEEDWLPCAGKAACEKTAASIEDVFMKLNFSEPSAVVTTLDGTRVELQNSASTRIKRAKLAKVLAAAETIKAQQLKYHESSKSLLESAKANFTKAIVGGWGNPTTPDESGLPTTFKTNRADDCKLAGGNGGKSLVFDIACLCTTSDSASGSKYTCGPKSGDNGSGWLDNNGDNQGKPAAKEAWKNLRADCRRQSAGVRVTPELISQSLVIFEGLIGTRAASGHDNARYIFGTVATAQSCGHSTATNKGSIDYKASNAQQRGDIEWEKNLRMAEGDLRGLLTAKQLVAALQARAEHLEDAAFTIFNESVLETQIAWESSRPPSTDANTSQKGPLQRPEKSGESSHLPSGSSHGTKAIRSILHVALLM